MPCTAKPRAARYSHTSDPTRPDDPVTRQVGMIRWDLSRAGSNPRVDRNPNSSQQRGDQDGNALSAGRMGVILKIAAMDTNRFRVRPGEKVNLRRYSPGDTAPFRNKRKVAGRLERGVERLAALQERL